MILPQTYGIVLALLVFSMLCWGSWANTFKLAGKWRFELYYFDFAFGLLLVSFLVALTLGNAGFDGFSLTDDLMHAGKRQWFYGFVAGIIFNFGNMLLMAAISVAGMSVAFPIGIGLAVIIGTVLNFFTSRTGNEGMLIGGCGLILGAMLLDGVAYSMLGVARHEVLAKAGKAKSTRRPSAIKGVVLSLVSGILMGCFAPLVRKGTEGDLGMGPYSMIAVFSLGVFFSTFAFNMFFMNLAVEGDPVEIGDYFRAPKMTHLLGFLGGAIWSLGTIAALIVSSPNTQVHLQPELVTGMGQAFAIVAALWGLLVWREFRGSDMRIKGLAVAMLLLWGLGLALISIAPMYARKL